jgi:hypothetical protein
MWRVTVDKPLFDKTLALVMRDGMKLQHMPLHLIDDRAIVMAAVNQNGNALLFASKRLKLDIEIVRAAVANTMTAIDHVPTCLIKLI